MKNVVSFCLYGCNATYIIGMRENIKLAKLHYPNWEIRIYHNSTVPNKYIEEYKGNGAICILCENIGENQFNWEGMNYPCGNHDIDRFEENNKGLLLINVYHEFDYDVKSSIAIHRRTTKITASYVITKK